MAEKTILLTGGAENVDSRTVVQLLKEGFRVCMIDKPDIFSVENSAEAVDSLLKDAGPDLSQKLEIILGLDFTSKDDLEQLFSKSKFDAVFHFAGMSSVMSKRVANLYESSTGNIIDEYADSNYFDWLYGNHDNDLDLLRIMNLHQIMAKYACKKMVFSTSSTVYGEPDMWPSTAAFNLKAISHYGLPMNPRGQRTRTFFEAVARHIQKEEPEWKIILKGVPNNLMPLSELIVYGQDLEGHSLAFFLSQFPKLMEIHLISCQIDTWPQNCCKFLVKLKLTTCSLGYYYDGLGDDPEFIISKCPVLEELELHHCFRLRTFTVQSPSLKSLVLVGRENDPYSGAMIKLKAERLQRFEISGFVFNGNFLILQAIPKTVALNFEFLPSTRPQPYPRGYVESVKRLFREVERFGIINLKIPTWMRTVSEVQLSDHEDEDEDE